MEELGYELDASSFIETPNLYENEFKNLMLNIYSCYEYLITKGEKVPANSENDIRDILLKYLKDTKIRNGYCKIGGYRFDKEVDEGKGRIDIKIITLNDFEDHDAYYIIECKRLDGKNTLNKAYATHGINRFTTSYKTVVSTELYYSSYYGVNGMIGFVVCKIDIHDNISKIGNFFNEIERNKFYESAHTDLKLYHLIMDFSDNLK